MIPLASEYLAGWPGPDDPPPMGLLPADLLDADGVVAVYKKHMRIMAHYAARAVDGNTMIEAIEVMDAAEKRTAWALVYGEAAGAA